MKTLILAAILTIASHPCYLQAGQSQAEVKRREAVEWSRRMRRYAQGQMNPNEKRAVEFERKMKELMDALQTRSVAVGLKIEPQKQLSGLDNLRSRRYSRGNMSPVEMKAYEKNEQRKMRQLEMPVAAAEVAARKKWRRENPVEARLQDIENAAMNANMAAQEAQYRAMEAENRAEEARNQAMWAEERARKAQRRADDNEQRLRDAGIHVW
ncbi:MAG: hypothetical protein HQ559_15445 [Lentisphaerae bacterium]|nr:hypothetical protein [Lentisphaerota bacterium]